MCVCMIIYWWKTNVLTKIGISDTFDQLKEHKCFLLVTDVKAIAGFKCRLVV